MQRADDLQGEHDDENRENREHERPNWEANRAGDDSNHQRDVERNHSQRTQAQGCAAAHQVKHHTLGTFVPPIFEEHVLRQPALQVIRGADDARERRADEQNCAVHRGFLVRIRCQCRVSAELQQRWQTRPARLNASAHLAKRPPSASQHSRLPSACCS